MKEYVRQLEDQQEGLNALTVGQYQYARSQYIALGRKGISDGAAQEAARERLDAHLDEERANETPAARSLLLR